MTQDLPIDIHYNKLQDWLLSRRHCKQDWSTEVLLVRKEINKAIQDMPPIQSITQLLHGTYINYFHCKDIVAILKETEGSSRTLFGSYSSKRLKDWLGILKEYEKDNIYLAEAAQLMSRYVSFEIPSLKRQQGKCSQALQDYSKKQTYYHKASIESADKLKSACKALGIEGKKLKKEIIGLLDDLPSFFDQVLGDVRKLDNEVNFYSAYVHFLSSGSKSKDVCLPLTKHLCCKGNTTVYEWRRGGEPEAVVKDLVDYGLEKEEDVEGEVQENEIDWGNLDTEVVEEVGTTADIDWGIEDVVVVEDMASAAGDAGVIASGEDGMARGEDALSILWCLHTRNELLDELHELEAFFAQRLLESKQAASSNFLDSLIFQSAPQSILISADDISVMLANVRSLINKFLKPNIKELFLICSFPKHVDKMVENLKNMTSDSEKLEAQSKVMVVRQAEMKEEMADLEPKLKTLREKTKILKKQMEEEISERYKNRKVNIMGEINSI